jgi:membrane-associated protease RseP (regulator of RpoE activity)
MLPNLHLDLSAFNPGSLAAISQPILVALVGSWMALLFHELGHAAAAVLVGVRIWGIRLGIGPTIWRGRIGNCRVHVALFPLLGAVHLLDEDACAIGYRDIVAGRWRFEWGPKAWRAPVISVAGGLSNLLGVLLLTLCWEALGHPTLASTAGKVLLFGVAANIGGYLNLLPCFRSDGIHLLAHIRAARFSLQPAPSAG